MARPRKNRLLPAIEEHIGELIAAIGKAASIHVRASTEQISFHLANLRRDISALERRIDGRALEAARKETPQRGRRRSSSTRTCTLPGCDRPHLAHGLCTRHYRQEKYAQKIASQEGRRVRPYHKKTERASAAASSAPARRRRKRR